jgi:signal peptidase I
MDITFPLILVILVGVTGAIALFDWLVLRKPRLQDLTEVENRFKGVNLDNEKQKKAYDAARAAAVQEPVAVEYAKSFFPVLAIVLVLRSFILEPFQIPSESMVPTLEVNDFILVNKFTYGLRLPVIRTKIVPINEPKRGDVMVFFPPHESRYFIKRVIGLPGDVIENIGNQLYINGEMASHEVKGEDQKDRGCGREDYIYTETIDGVEHALRKCQAQYYRDPLTRDDRDGRWVVPEGHYFMMGDNRDNSQDSRVWGPVPEERIVGKAFAIWMNWDAIFSIPTFDRVGGIQ